MPPPIATKLLPILDATGGREHLEQAARLLGWQPGFAWGMVLHAAGERDAAAAILGQQRNRWELRAASGGAVDPIVATRGREHGAETVAYVPCGENLGAALREALATSAAPDLISPLLPVLAWETHPRKPHPLECSGWVAPIETALALEARTPAAAGWSFPRLIEAAGGGARRWRWNSCRVQAGDVEGIGSGEEPAITNASRVLAVVPHFGCEEWLEQCLHSLTTQSRPPENILVVDDGSEEPPREIVRRFPEVTLLATEHNIGPERILHDVVRSMDYDAYMIQDADDWCAFNRLQMLLEGAERTGAVMVGGQEMRLGADGRSVLLRLHPMAVNRAVDEEIGHYVCHGTSLFARSAAKRVGGFDRSLEVGADTDFTLRVSFAGRIANLPHAQYYRRMRNGSRTSASSTGEGSELRLREREFIFARARRYAEEVRAGKAPEVEMANGTAPVKFRHLLGPAVRMRDW